MPNVQINGKDYASFITVQEADDYLAGDAVRAAGWAAIADPDAKARALVSATRLLLRLTWLEPAPTTDAAPQAVKDAAALLAADIAAKPAVGDDPSTGSNVKSVKAGSAQVEFFRPTIGRLLPVPVWALIGSLLGSVLDDGSLDGVANGSSALQPSRFDPTDYALLTGTDIFDPGFGTGFVGTGDYLESDPLLP